MNQIQIQIALQPNAILVGIGRKWCRSERLKNYKSMFLVNQQLTEVEDKSPFIWIHS